MVCKETKKQQQQKRVDLNPTAVYDIVFSYFTLNHLGQ